MNQDYANIHNTLVHRLDEQAMEGSGFTFLRNVIVIIEIYKIKHIQASLYIELPTIYKKIESIENFY